MPMAWRCLVPGHLQGWQTASIGVPSQVDIRIEVEFMLVISVFITMFKSVYEMSDEVMS